MFLKNLFGLIVALLAGMMIVYGAPAAIIFIGWVEGDWTSAWSMAGGLVFSGALAIRTLVFQ